MVPFIGSTSFAVTLYPSARRNGCTVYDPSGLPLTYGCDPNRLAGVVLTGLLILSTCGHVYDTFRCRE